MATALPPGPTWTIPNTLRLVRDPYTTLRDLRKTYGDLVTFPGLNGKIVLAMTPELAKPILVAPADTYGPYAAATIGDVLGKRSLLATEGEIHRHDRKLLTPPFHGARMRAYGEAMRALSRDRFGAALTPGATVRMLDVTTDITVDVILRSVFGVADGPDFDEGRRWMRELVNVSPLLFFTQYAHTRWYSGYRQFVTMRQNFRAWLGKRIDEARNRGEAGEDILAMMIAARYDDGSAMSDDDLDGQLVTLLFAGHETTAIALAWAVHWLWRHPDALARLRDEVAAAGIDAEPEVLARLPFLGAVCDETLRLHPIVTENLRLLKKPLELGGYTLPEGVGVGVAIAPIHEDESIYTEPSAFRPERFLERKFTPFEYLPFGGGHRRCIGSAFANQELRLALAVLVHGWELELLRPDEKPVRRSATLGPAHGVPVRVIGRR